jgi:Zn-dependent protease with chaperone function
LDFFERQEQARRRTGWLVALFVFAVAAIVAGVMAGTVLLGVWVDSGGREELIPTADWLGMRWHVVAGVGLWALAMIAGGSLVKILSLRRGGERIAESLGGRPLVVGRELHELRLLNVVEEMSIAAGIECPRVYLLDDESAVNAFAAGFTPEDAVIGVTRGAASALERDELQGVIAHEFSHILNGDMRLNLRLVGLLSGIVLISASGRALLRLARRSLRVRTSGKKGNAGVVLVVFGVVLVVVGYIGLVAARVIKATVSREREYLADASAVQFTRNPHGIGGALLKLLQRGSQLEAPSEEVSHLLFGAGGSLGRLFATHPPLEDRIRAIDPALLREGPEIRETAAPERAQSDDLLAFAELPQADRPPPRAPLMPHLVARATGEIRAVHLRRAQARLREIPEWLRGEIVFPDSAQAACLALLLASDDARSAQLEAIARALGGDARQLAERFASGLAQLDAALRLPLVELALPALRMLPPERRERFLGAARAVAAVDRTVSVLEWTLLSLLEASLTASDAPARAERATLARLRDEAVRLVAIAVRISGSEDEPARAAFSHACIELGFDAEPPTIGDWHSELTACLNALHALRPAHKRQMLDALAAAFLADRAVTLAEVEVLRAIGAALGCPIPPLEPGDVGPTSSPDRRSQRSS